MATATMSIGSAGGSTSTSGTSFAGGSEAALAELIKALQGGGTAEMQASSARRAEEVSAVRGQRADYTKEAAFTDAQGAMDAQRRQALEQLLPSINAASAGAGTSRSSMRALLLQDAAQKASDSASALGLKASVDYGNISTGLSGVLENLTRMENPQTAMLLQAIQTAKGQNSTQTASGGVASSGGSTRSNGGVAYGAGTSSSPWDSYYNRLDNDGSFAASRNQTYNMSYDGPLVTQRQAEMNYMDALLNQAQVAQMGVNNSPDFNVMF
jgi:hypothetical protein